MPSLNPYNSYRETRVKTASQARLIVMLYDEAMHHVDMAIEKMSVQPIPVNSYGEINNSINKAQDVIGELIASLDFEKGGDIAPSLFNLYSYFNRELSQSNLDKKAGALPEVRRMMNELREAWVAIDGNNPVQPERGAFNIAG